MKKISRGVTSGTWRRMRGKQEKGEGRTFEGRVGSGAKRNEP